ncbi:MAG: DegV family protein [Clostridia bacterium]|nr:DegV family protein [Clostridia bacterium]
MSEYVIYTDSACDIDIPTLEEWDVRYISLSLTFEDEGRVLYNDEVEPVDFYNRMRKGDVAKTAAINIETFKRTFEQELRKGRDILYIGFSTGLSTTTNSAFIAAKQLEETYPDNRVVCVDSLCASAGQGMLVYLAVQKRDGGHTLDEVASYIEDTKLRVCHWFTVDDLVYLKRGGRVSSGAAFVGGMLGIKPVMHVDKEGQLVPVFKARGRRAALKGLVDRFGESVIDKDGPVFICHADCDGDVEILKNMLGEQYGANVDKVVYTGPVIGAHSGPGTIALFFLGSSR